MKTNDWAAFDSLPMPDHISDEALLARRRTVLFAPRAEGGGTRNLAARYVVHCEQGARRPWSFTLQDEAGFVVWRSPGYRTRSAAVVVATSMMAWEVLPAQTND